MISLIPLSIDGNNWNEFTRLYMNSFPTDERRELNELYNIQDIEDYTLLEILYNDKFIGFLELWEFENFIFLEHLALERNEQQKGYGTDVLKRIISESSKPLILEAEPAVDSISDKRIQFYRKSGFKVLNFDYTQPPYYPGKKSVPMLLLSNQDLSDNVIGSCVGKIRDIVYKIY